MLPVHVPHILSHSVRIDAWRLEVAGREAGTLALHSTKPGLLWVWTDKPADLVELLGVREGDVPGKPYYFYDSLSALDHLMRCTGVAFDGHCGLAALELP